MAVAELLEPEKPREEEPETKPVEAVTPVGLMEEIPTEISVAAVDLGKSDSVKKNRNSANRLLK